MNASAPLEKARSVEKALKPAPARNFVGAAAALGEGSSSPLHSRMPAGPTGGETPQAKPLFA